MDTETQTILELVKEQLGINPSDEAFDVELIQDINITLFTLMQLGVVTRENAALKSKEDTFEELIEDEVLCKAVQTYMYAKVRLIFDPPTSSIVAEALKETVKEYEWRFRSEVEYSGGENQNDVLSSE